MPGKWEGGSNIVKGTTLKGCRLGKAGGDFVNSNLASSPSVWKCEPVFTRRTTFLILRLEALPTLMATHARTIELTVAARVAVSF